MTPLRFAVIGRGPMANRMRALVGDVERDQAEAIYIANRNRDHVDATLAALEEGKAVLCEKPAAMSVAGMAEMIAVSQRKRLLYMEAVATPFLPAVGAALAVAGSGRLGALRRVEASFGYPVTHAAFPRLFEGDGGVLADRAIYPLMLALLALGPARLADVRVQRDGRGIDVAARLRLDHDGGAISDLAVSLGERLDNSLWIEGEAGTVEVAPPLLAAQRIVITRAGQAAPSAIWRRSRQNPVIRRIADLRARGTAGWHPHGGSPWQHQVAHFTALYRTGAIESPVVSHDRMLAAARLIEEARTA